jgi:hypothetical protein
MPSSTDELDREIRELLYRKADGLEPPASRLEPTIRRSNRRLARNAMVGLLAVALLGSGAAVGVRSLTGPARTRPANPSPAAPAGSLRDVVQIPFSMAGTFPLGLAGGQGVIWVVSGGNIGFPPMIGALSDPSADVGEATLSRIPAGTEPPYQVSDTVSVGKAGDVGVVSAFGDAWVLRPAFDRVIRIDGTSLAKVSTIQVSSPSGAAADREALWVVSLDGTLTRIDPRTNRVIASIGTGVPAIRGFQNDGAQPPMSPNNGVPATGVAVGDGSVWVRGGGRLVRVDPSTESVQATIDIGGTIEGLAVGDSNVWLTVCTPAVPPCTWELVRIDATTNTIGGRRVLGGWETTPRTASQGDIGRAGITLSSGSVWVALAVVHGGGDYGRGRVLQIDPASEDVVAWVEVPGSGGTTVGGKEEKHTSDILGPVVIEGGAAWVINIESQEVVRLVVSNS